MKRVDNRAPTEPRRVEIPDYELLSFIGDGAYGDVWLARSITETLCAVKIVYRDRFEDQRPFDREVEGIRRFHPISRRDEGLIDLLHVGQKKDEGYFYYVMELADNLGNSPAIVAENYCPRTLDRVLSTQGRLPFQSALELGISLSKALACLHRNGLVHRDVKTNNVVYVNGRAKLTDMGMVSRVIDSHSFVGTEGFIAPEGPGTPQADVYALGKVLYEACMGKDRKEFPDLPDQIDTWPEAEQLREFNEVLLKACDGDPRKRHQTAEELYADLACLLNGKSIRKLRALERRVNQFKRAAVWLAVVGVGASVLGYEVSRERARRAEDLARTVATHLVQGQAHIDNGDFIQALPSLVEAISSDSKERQELNRVRLSSVLDQCPKLTHLGWHSNEVTDARFNKDGKLVVISTRDNRARVYDARSGNELGQPFGPSNEVETVCFSPDETRILVASELHSVSLWDWRSGTRVFFVTNNARAMVARFNHKGDLFMVGWLDGAVALYESKTGKRVHEFPDQKGGVDDVVFSHDDRFVVTASRNGSATIWSVADRQQAAPPLRHRSWVMGAAFAPNDDVLVTGCADHSAYVWEWRTGRQLVPKLQHRDGVSSVDISPDGALILTTSWDRTARLWLMSSGKPYGLNSVLPHSAKVLHGAFGPDGRVLVTASFDGTSRIWDLAGMRPSPKVMSGLISESGNRLLTVTSNRLEIMELRNEQIITSIPLSTPPLAADISANGKFVLSTSSNEHSSVQLYIWDSNSGKLLSAVPQFTNSIARVRLSPRGKMLASWSRRSLNVLGIPNQTFILSNVVCKSSVSNVVFSSDDRLIVVAAGREALCFDPWKEGPWQTNIAAARFVLKHATDVQSVCFSEDNRFLVTACADWNFTAFSAQVWDSRTGQPVGRPIKHTDGVVFACFDGTGRYVLSGGEDFDAIVTASAGALSGAALSTKRLQHGSRVVRGCFSSDNNLALTVELDRFVRLWDVRTGFPITARMPEFMTGPPLSNASGLNFGSVWEAGAFPTRAGFVDRFSVATTDKFRQTRIWRPGWQKESLSELRVISRVLNGFMAPSPITGAGALSSDMPEAETARTWAALKVKYPEDFEISPIEITTWHKGEALAAEQDGNTFAVGFHQKFEVCP